jgi:uncharacterized RDD family membrane protein YckC
VYYRVADDELAGVATGVFALELAGAGRRAAARLIDSLLATVGCLAIFMIIGLLDELVDPSGDGDVGALLFLLVLPVACVVWGIRYHVRATRRWGRTPGKWIFGLKVVPLWTNGARGLDIRTAVVREGARGFAAVVPGVNIAIGMVLLAQMLRNRPYWQSKWDREAGTVVVRWSARMRVGN